MLIILTLNTLTEMLDFVVSVLIEVLILWLEACSSE